MYNQHVRNYINAMTAFFQELPQHVNPFSLLPFGCERTISTRLVESSIDSICEAGFSSEERLFLLVAQELRESLSRLTSKTSKTV